MPTVSIIIPIYNVEPYIRRCLQSVMDQTLTSHSSRPSPEGESSLLECILVDDCGQDKSMDIAQRMVDEYKGNIDFHIIHHEKNRGLSAARNTGIRVAKGEWLYFLDSDDWIIPECIELMMGCVEKHPDSQIVFSGAEPTNSAYRWLDYTEKTLPEYSDERDWLQLSMLKRYDFGMTAWNKLIRRKFILDNNLFFVEGLIHEDEVWNFDVAKHVLCASFLQSNTYVYNIRENSIVSKRTEAERLDRLFRIWKIMAKRIKGRSRQLQAKALCSFIAEKTCNSFPADRKNELCVLFINMGIADRSYHSLLYFAQALITKFFPYYYANIKILSRITLYR